jgi:hypothetical protein
MDVKLTLKLDEDIIKKAKVFALENNTSLSRLIENYLLKITTDNNEPVKITSLVKSLSGIIDSKIGNNYQNETIDFLINKLK